MTEEEFMKGFREFKAGSSWAKNWEKYQPWISWITKPENHDLFMLVVGPIPATEEEIRTAWHVRNSPLVKALK